MSLSKQQMIGAVGAGVFLLCAGDLGFMLYSAWSERGELEEMLQGHNATYDAYYNAKVFPSKASIDSVKSNAQSFVAWREAAVALAARGDMEFPGEAPTIFKQRLQGEVRRMAALPGGVAGKISAPGFLFGFEHYLGEGGALPADKDVPRLAMQLNTIARVVELFADAGVLEVKAVKRIEETTEAEEERAPKKKGKGKKAAAAEEDPDAPKETCLKYAFEIATRPAGLVEALNRLTSCERFATVKNLSFKQSVDTIVNRLSAIEGADAQKTGGTRSRGTSRRHRASSLAAVLQNDAKAGGDEADPLVTDPESSAPITVNFVLEVRDFGRAAKAQTPVVANGEEAEKKEARE